MNKKILHSVRPILLIFVFITAFCLTGKNWLEKNGISQPLVLAGNFILFMVSLLSYFIHIRSYRSANPQSSVRGLYGSFMIRFFVLALSAFIYIMFAKKDVNKPGLIICAGLYILYTAFETKALMQTAKQKKDA
jgi:hypothetical protein